MKANSCRHKQCKAGELQAMCEQIDEDADHNDDPSPATFRVVAATDQVSSGDELLESRCWLLDDTIFGFRWWLDQAVLGFTFDDSFVFDGRCYQRPRKSSYQRWHLSCLRERVILLLLLLLSSWEENSICHLSIRLAIIAWESIYYSIVVVRWRWCSCYCFALTSREFRDIYQSANSWSYFFFIIFLMILCGSAA